MYKTILVPLDGSERAERILPHVEELAHKFGAKLLLVRVVEPILVGMSPYNNESPFIVAELERRSEEAKAYLAKLESEFAKKSIAVQSYVEYGTVVPTILEIASREQVELIALGSHGRTGLARVFYGSVAAGILHAASSPLLLIRTQE